MSDDISEERKRALMVLVELGDQVQELCANAGVEISAFVIFSAAGPVVYRSPHPRQMIVDHMRVAADELERDL